MAKKPALRLTRNALSILEKRYLRKDGRGKPAERPEGLFRRVAENIALAEAKYLFPGETERLPKKQNTGEKQQKSQANGGRVL